MITDTFLELLIFKNSCSLDGVMINTIFVRFFARRSDYSQFPRFIRLKSSLKSVLSLRFDEIPDYNFYINAMKQGFRDALNETMPVSPPTFKNSNQSDSLNECDELLE